uniref:Uncharacterized protein n=1 Tax=Trypanosoma congolense (strain IL3000) TaxID=1068625 RepID=G0UMT9_TRYCI|nr:hypothetical protein, unlikely [Trypanosoma congolense IL3000]
MSMLRHLDNVFFFLRIGFIFSCAYFLPQTAYGPERWIYFLDTGFGDFVASIHQRLVVQLVPKCRGLKCGFIMNPAYISVSFLCVGNFCKRVFPSAVSFGL